MKNIIWEKVTYDECNYCYYRTGNNQCSLFFQRNMRKIDISFFDDEIKNSNGECIFKLSDGDRFCPRIKKDGLDYFINQEYIYFYSRNRYIIKSEKIKHDSALKASIDDYENKYIYFCPKEGAVHDSYCRYCKSHTDAHKERENSPKRTIDHCLKRTFIIGQIKLDRVYYLNQYVIDGGMLSIGYSPTILNKTLLVPIPVNFIKNAYSLDIPHWDKYSYSESFCYRCGPEKTWGYHYYCQNCGTRQLCDNCVIDLKFIRINKDIEAQFICPDCKIENRINLGQNYENAVSYFKYRHSPKNREIAKQVIEVDYYMILTRYKKWMNNNFKAVDIEVPIHFIGKVDTSVL